MTTAAIRKKLMTYIADADDRKVKAIFTLVENEIKQEEVFKLSDEQMMIVEEERAKYVSGKEKAIPWRKSLEKIRKKRK